MSETLPRDCLIVKKEPFEVPPRYQSCLESELMSRVSTGDRALRTCDIAVQEGCEEETVELAERLSHAIAVNAKTSEARSRIWVENLLNNLPYLCTHPSAMTGSFDHDVPAFIVGNGPSLEKNLAHLLAAKSKGVVFAINGATKLVPHQIQVCTESNDLRHKLARADVLSCFALTCDPAVMRHANRVSPIWCGEIGHVVEHLTGVPPLIVCGSASITALDLARGLGCRTIVLVGQDMAWSDGKVYAHQPGTATAGTDSVRLDWQQPDYKRADPLPREMDRLEVPAWGGGTVLSSSNFDPMVRWLSYQGKHSEGFRLINATEGGARIEGWVEERLEDVVAGLPSRGPLRMLGDKTLEPEQVMAWLDVWQRELRDDPANCVLLQSWITAPAIAMLEAFRNGHVTKRIVKQARVTVDQLVAEAAGELRAVLVGVSAQVARSR